MRTSWHTRSLRAASGGRRSSTVTPGNGRVPSPRSRSRAACACDPPHCESNNTKKETHHSVPVAVLPRSTTPSRPPHRRAHQCSRPSRPRAMSHTQRVLHAGTSTPDLPVTDGVEAEAAAMAAASTTPAATATQAGARPMGVRGVWCRTPGRPSPGRGDAGVWTRVHYLCAMVAGASGDGRARTDKARDHKT